MPTSKKTVLVTGATGKQGGAVARLLLQKGHAVKALTRQPESQPAASLRSLGADIVTGSMEDKPSLERAASGVDSIFAMSTPFEAGMEAEVNQGKAVADVAHAIGAHLVYSSVAWADKNTGIPHFDSKAEVEAYIAQLGLRHSIPAPVYFMENLFAPWMLSSLRDEKVLAVPLTPDVPLFQIPVANIAALAVLAIEDPERVVGRRDIAGDIVTGNRSAEVISQMTGLDVQYSPIKIEAIRSNSEDLALMFEYFQNNRPRVNIDALRRDFPEIAWLNYEEWARSQDWTVLSSPA